MHRHLWEKLFQAAKPSHSLNVLVLLIVILIGLRWKAMVTLVEYNLTNRSLLSAFSAGSEQKPQRLVSVQKELEHLAQRSPIGLGVLNQLALAYLSTNADDLAEDALLRAISFRSREDLIRYRLGELYWKRGNPVAAIEQWQQAGAGGVFWQRTLAAFHKEDWQNVEINLDLALQTGANLSYLDRINAGNWLMRFGQIERAIEQYRLAIRQNPADQSARVILAKILVATTSDLDSAIELLAPLRANPDDMSPYLALGDIYVGLGQYDKAEIEYSQVTQKHPEIASGWSSLCRASEQQGRYDAALDYCLKAVSLAPTDYSSHEALGIVLIRVGDFSQAIKVLEQALVLGEAYGGGSRFWLASAYLEVGRPRDAINALLLSVERNPTEANSFLLLSKTYWSQGQRNEAVQSAETGLKYSPAYAPLHMLLGDFSLTQGDRGMALTHYRNAIAADPNLSEAKTKLRQLEMP